MELFIFPIFDDFFSENRREPIFFDAKISFFATIFENFVTELPKLIFAVPLNAVFGLFPFVFKSFFENTGPKLALFDKNGAGQLCPTAPRRVLPN
jgi:hypothetical protein